MMRFNGLLAAAAVCAVAATATALQAQELAGTGPYASPIFRLEAGLAVFDLEYRGPGRFTVVLLDDRADVVARLADATGAFARSSAVRVPRTGLYLLDVEADGAWTVRLRDAPADAFVMTPADAPAARPAPLPEARIAGEAAGGGWSWGWFARGLIGGTLAGPIGAGVVVHRAGRSDIPPPPVPNPGPAAAGPGFVVDYRNAYADRYIARRKSAAFVGGIVGSTAFLFALIQALEVSGDGGGGGSAPGTDPQLSFTIVVHP